MEIKNFRSIISTQNNVGVGYRLRLSYECIYMQLRAYLQLCVQLLTMMITHTLSLMFPIPHP